MISVAIVDDDPIVCSSIGTILTATGTAQVLWSAHDGETAVANYRRHAPDVLLIDVQMPGIDGLEAAARILRGDPDARILILTTFADPDYIRRAIDLHTKGYLIKQDVASVVPAVQAVMAGQVVLGAEVRGRRIGQPRDRGAFVSERRHGAQPHQRHPGQDEHLEPHQTRRRMARMPLMGVRLHRGRGGIALCTAVLNAVEQPYWTVPIVLSEDFQIVGEFFAYNRGSQNR